MTDILVSFSLFSQQKVEQQHHIQNLLESIRDQSQIALDVFEDKDSAVTEELATMKGANAFGSFYENLKQVKVCVMAVDAWV